MNGCNEASAASGPSSLRGFDDYDVSLGDLMRGERATLGKSLLDVQRDIKLKAEYLAAIEDGNLEMFETPGFVSGYVRGYARYLGMDPDWVYEKFCSESGFSQVSGLDSRARRRPAGAGAPTLRAAAAPRSGDAILQASPLASIDRAGPFEGLQPGSIGAVLVLIGLIAGLGYGGWTVLQEVQRVTLAPVEMPLGSDRVSGEAPVASDDPASAVPTVAALERLYRPQALDRPVFEPRDAPIATLDPRSQGLFAAWDERASRGPVVPAPELPPPLSEAQSAAAGTRAEAAIGPRLDTAAPAVADIRAEPQQTPPVQVTVPPPPKVVVFATDAAWVRIRAGDGTVLLEKILESGERFVVPDTVGAATLRAGNAGAVYFAVDGQTIGPAGAPGGIAREVELSADVLQAVYSPPDLTANPALARLAQLATEALPGSD